MTYIMNPAGAYRSPLFYAFMCIELLDLNKIQRCKLIKVIASTNNSNIQILYYPTMNNLVMGKGIYQRQSRSTSIYGHRIKMIPPHYFSSAYKKKRNPGKATRYDPLVSTYKSGIKFTTSATCGCVYHTLLK